MVLSSEHPVARFVGVDLGWYGKTSGVALLEWDGRRLQLSSVLSLPAAGLAQSVSSLAQGPAAVIGVDAPLVIRNTAGMREADRLAHKKYGRYHAGCYPANLNLPFAAATTGFSRALCRAGFAHATALEPQASGLFQAEVFPHAGIVQLLGLPQIVKYKKGRLAQRRAGLERLRNLMAEGFAELEPSLAAELPLVEGNGPRRKDVEDRLDAVICAYLAAHWWYWGLERNEVLGDANNGYIVVPKRRTSPAGAPLLCG
ncbi:MAG: DUF429 domain-containing protein [Bryobacteraceae bacterium]|nr:DUF429 domain-containing protein [Bryobacteraceae bacterium]